MRIAKQFINDKNNVIKYEVFSTDVVHNIPFFVNKEYMGRAVVVEPIDCDWKILLDISVEVKGKGYGSELMAFLKEFFDNMLTLARNKKVERFLIKNGFEEHVSGENQPNYYTFKKGKEELDIPKWVSK